MKIQLVPPKVLNDVQITLSPKEAAVVIYALGHLAQDYSFQNNNFNLYKAIADMYGWDTFYVSKTFREGKLGHSLNTWPTNWEDYFKEQK